MFAELRKLAKSLYKRNTLRELKILLQLQNRYSSKSLRAEMISLTYIGSAGIIWTIPALILMKNKKKRFDGLLVLTGIATDVAFNNIVTKFLFHRKRPWTYFLDMYSPNSLSLGYSFPSGHALANTTAATIFILIDKNNIIWAVPLAGGISFSRLYLFAHFPTDVFFGICDGVLTGFLTYKIGYYLKDKGYLKRIETVLNNDYFFKYSNFFKEPITYLKNLLSDLFLPETIKTGETNEY